MELKTMTKQRGQSHKPCSPRSEQRQNSEKELSKTEKSTHSAKVSAEDEHILAALDKLRGGAPIKSEDVSDRILCQAATAILGHWQPKDKSVGDKLATAASALAEMQPSSATELMLAAQMLAVIDAVFLFMSQATLDETPLEKRDFYNFYTEKAGAGSHIFNVPGAIGCHYADRRDNALKAQKHDSKPFRATSGETACRRHRSSLIAAGQCRRH